MSVLTVQTHTQAMVDLFKMILDENVGAGTMTAEARDDVLKRLDDYYAHLTDGGYMAHNFETHETLRKLDDESKTGYDRFLHMLRMEDMHTMSNAIALAAHEQVLSGNLSIENSVDLVGRFAEFIYAIADGQTPELDEATNRYKIPGAIAPGDEEALELAPGSTVNGVLTIGG